MDTVLLALRLLLSGVFAVAGLAKLVDRPGSAKALADFGLPAAAATPVAIGLPICELAVAAALLPLTSAWYAAIGALLLLTLFALVISINLARGRAPACRCFGQLSSTPVGWSTVVRNSILAATAAFIVWQGPDHTGQSVVGWAGGLTIWQRAAFVMCLVGLTLLAALGWLLIQVLQQQGRIVLRLDDILRRIPEGQSAPPAGQMHTESTVGLPVGSAAPNFRLAGLHGETLTLQGLLAAGKPVLLFFTNPNCGPCQSLMPELSRWQREHSAALTIALVSEGAAKENRRKAREYGVSNVLVQKKREVADTYHAHGTPGAVLIRPDGTIASPVAMGAEQVQSLLTQAMRTAAPTFIPGVLPAPPGNGRERAGLRATADAPAAKLGQSAPALSFQDLGGQTVAFNTLRGRETLLLFWNPGCGFCQQMLGKLKAWEASPPSGAPRLVVVSTGSREDNLALDLKSPVLLDPNGEAASAFGAHGTPMGVLLDTNATIASEVAAGADAVLELAAAGRMELKAES